MPGKQKLNLVDENDNIIGQDIRENIHQKGLLHREVYVWIYNREGAILFQKRSMTKDTYPGLLDASVGGHVEPNDDYDKAAIRELEEETGIKANKNDLVYITKIRSKSYDKTTGMTNNVFRAIYAYKYGDKQNIRLEKGQATRFEFWTLEELLNISEKDRKKIIPILLSEKYIDIFRKIKNLIIINQKP